MLRFVAVVLMIGLCLSACWASPLTTHIRGIDIFPFNATVTSSAALIAELSNAAQMGTNCIAVNYMLAMQNATSNVVLEAPGVTPNLQQLGALVDAAHALGMSVLLKPLIVCGHNCQMLNITPADPTLWFESYAAYMLPLAQFAQNRSVEYLSVGLELAPMTASPIYLPGWRAFIPRLRSVYSGLLTYCSIMYPVETSKIGFWDLLDFISMDTYLPLVNATTGQVLSPSQMQDHFKYYFGLVGAWLAAQPANVSSLPVVLSEVGYPSSVAGMLQPYLAPSDGCVGSAASNFTLQAQAFQALYDTAPNYAWLLGTVVFWFDNPSTSDYYPNRQQKDDDWACSWTVRGKPAECVIAAAYGGTCNQSLVEAAATHY
jgi:hypothetical protein